MPPRPDRSFLRPARLVAGFTLLSRVLGLLRDAATAHLLGAGVVADALTYAWTLPNAFRRLFGEGALSTAFVPVFSGVLEKEGRERARQVANNVVSALALVLGLLAAALVLLLGVLPEDSVTAFFGGNVEKARLTLWYGQLLLPYLAFICVVAQFMAVLNAVGEFAVPALSPVVLNVVWIAGAGLALLVGGAEADPRPRQAEVLVAAILASAVLQFLFHLPKLSALGLGFRIVRPRFTPEVRRLLAMLGPMLVGMGSGQISVLVDRTVAMAALPDGGTTHLYYGMRLMQFPLGLVSVALTTAVYPTLARLVVRREREAVLATVGLALRTNLLVSASAGLGLAALASPIVVLLFQGGAFDERAAALTAEALLGYAVGVPFAGTVLLLTRASYAAGDLRLPVRTSLVALLLNVALDLALVGPLGGLGLALATSLTSAVTAVLLAVGLRRRLELQAAERLLAGAGPSLVLALLMGAAVALVDALLAPHLPGGRTGGALRVLAGMATGLGIVLALAPRWCRDEWSALLGARARRRAGPGS